MRVRVLLISLRKFDQSLVPYPALGLGTRGAPSLWSGKLRFNTNSPRRHFLFMQDSRGVGEGRRIFPGSSSRNDSKYQLRIECGSTLQNLMKIVLQVNKQVKEGSLKSFLEASERGVHANVVKAII